MLDRLIARAIVAVVFVLSLAPSPTALASEFLFVDDFEIGATLTGRVLDTNAFVDQGVELPVEGVVVTLLGVSDTSVTGLDGSFILRNVPPGEQVLDLNTGSAIPAPTGDGYAGFRERIVLQGFENVLRPFYLPRIDASSLTTIDPSQTTVVENPGLEISMTVVAGSARGEDGSLFDGQLSISEVPGGVAPAALPAFLEPGILITVQPVGVTFDPPAPITFPNFDNLPPGSETDLWSLDPELGQFAIVGTGQVSGDGERIETISGGIIAADWHGAPPPPPQDGDGDGDGPPSCKGCCPSCSGSVGSSVDLFNGEFSESVRLPTVLSMNREWAPEFVYTSKRAFPLSVIPINSGIVSRAATPNMISYRGFIEDELVQDEIFIDTSTLAPATDEPFRVAVPFDNTTLETGIHDAEVRITSIYDRSRISSSNAKPLTVVNEIGSPFGAGWSLNGLDRLVLDEPGTIRERLLLVQGDGGAIQLEEQLTGVNPDGIITIISLNDQTAPVQSQEIGTLVDVLTDMGFASQVVDAVDFGQEHVDQSRLLIWVDASFVIIASNLNIQHVPDLLLEARANGMPLYFLGSEPANFRDFTNDGTADAFIDSWLDLVHLNLASSTNGGQGVVNVLDTEHPIFDGPAGILTQYEVSDDVDVTRGSDSGESVLASTATADIVLVNEFEAGGRTVVQNHTFLRGQPVDFQDEIEIVIRNSVAWLLDSPSISSGFFGEGQFAAVDGDYSGIIRDEVAGTFTRVLRDGSIHLYDDSGLLTSVIDRNGNMTTHGYDGSGRLQTITDPVGRVTTFAYDANGNLDTVTDAAGRITDFTVDASGNLSDMTLPDGSARGFGYDARHLMTSQTSARGFTTQYEYDDLGFFAQSIQSDGSVRQISATQKIGLVDTSGGLGSIADPAPIARPDAALSSFTDPDGGMVVANTGRFGEPLDVAGLDGLLTSIERDEDGNPLEVSHPSGRSESASFDPFGNLLSYTDHLVGGTYSAVYDTSLAMPTEVTDPSGGVTTMTYDAIGNPTSITSPAGRADVFAYNTEGQLLTWTPRSGPTLEYSYDGNGLVQNLQEGDGIDARATSFQRAASGQIETVIDPEGRSATFVRDDAGRIIEHVRPDGSSAIFDRDAEGNPVAITPPGSLPHAYDYTHSGLVSAYRPPDIAGTEDIVYTYSPAELLTRIDLPDGRAVINSYDSAARLVSRQIERGIVTYGYDAATGLLTSISAPGGQGLAFEYLGELPTRQTWSGSVTGNVARTYTPSKLLAGESVNGGTTVLYGYDADGLVTSAGSLSLTRDGATGRLAASSLGLVTTSLTYNAFGELAGHAVTFDGTPLFSIDLMRDRLGRVTEKEETILGTTDNYVYAYDDFGRLQQVERNAAQVTSYTYSANGNRLTRSNGSTIETGLYDAQDRVVSYAGASYTHRQSGERLTRVDGSGATGYTYDELGNLIGVAQPDGTAVGYIIDGLDRRIGKRVDGVLIRAWLYRDEYSPVAELDGAGALVSRFVYATQTHVPDYMLRDGETYRIITDNLGSVRLVVNVADATIAQRLDYDAFGRVVGDTNPGFQPFGFAGGLYDPDTGLVRFDARDYDPFTGRWTARDSILFEGASMNLYEYVDSDPRNSIDTTGLRSNASDDEKVPVGRIVDIDGPRLWVIRKGSDGVERRYQACMDQTFFLDDRFETDSATNATLQFTVGGRAVIKRDTTVTVNTLGSVREPPGNPLKIRHRHIFNNFERQDQEFQIKTAGGVIGIEG